MRQLGNAAHLLHIGPKDWDELTVEQADILLDWLDAYKDQLDEAEAEMRR